MGLLKDILVGTIGGMLNCVSEGIFIIIVGGREGGRGVSQSVVTLHGATRYHRMRECV